MVSDIFWLSLSIFLMMDAVGNIPAYISVLYGIEHKRQRIIIVREMLIALAVIYFFNFAGKALLNFIHISQCTVQISGGLILFLIAMQLVFPKSDEREDTKDLKKIKDPFIVPLAIPLVAGPAVLAAIMIYGNQVDDIFIISISIFIAWVASLLILIISPYIAKKLGERGIIAIQRLMGLILILMATEMFFTGLKSFLNAPSV